MEAANRVVPLGVAVNDSPNDAWKRYTVEVVGLISKNKRPSVFRDYNSLLMENRDLKKQYKMAITALETMITAKGPEDSRNNSYEKKESSNHRNCKILGNTAGDMQVGTLKDIHMIKGNSKLGRKELESDVSSVDADKGENNYNASNFQDCKTPSNFRIIKKKFEQQPENHLSSSSLNKEPQKGQEFLCANCLRLKSELCKDVQEVTDNDILLKPEDLCHLKRDLEQANESNISLKEELKRKKKENDELREQIHSLELSLKTLTEAINLQDEQLTEYGSVVTLLKGSRCAILEKMKDACAINSYNVKIMENIEQEVEQLKRQIDTYNELLRNQDIQLIDNASVTEQCVEEQNAQEEIMKKKDNYITLLQDRLCEAIVDLRNKDSEIKNHANSVKTLVNNYEAEKKCLEESLKFANVSAEKLEEHKIKQHETMKQLMKLIEFLQEKLEKMNRK